jgi:hypothetical protein
MSAADSLSVCGTKVFANQSERLVEAKTTARMKESEREGKDDKRTVT